MTTDIITAAPTPTPPMPEVEGTFEREDYLAQLVHLWERGNPRWFRRIARWTLLPLMVAAALFGLVPCGLVVYYLASGRPFQMELVLFFGLPLFLVLVIVWLIPVTWDETSHERMRQNYRWGLRFHARVLVWLGQLHLGVRWRLSLSPEEFIDVVEHDQWAGVRMRARFEYRMPWDLIQAIDVTEEYLFLVLDKKQIVPIPRRWFPDQASFDDYGRTAWEYWVGATQPPDTRFPGDPPPARDGPNGGLPSRPADGDGDTRGRGSPDSRISAPPP